MTGTVLELKHLKAMVDHLEELSHKPWRGDQCYVINQAIYDDYKAAFNLADEQMSRYWVVSSYIK